MMVGPEVQDSSIKEKFRTMQIAEDVYFAEKPLCVFTYFATRNELLITSGHKNRLFSRAQ